MYIMYTGVIRKQLGIILDIWRTKLNCILHAKVERYWPQSAK